MNINERYNFLLDCSNEYYNNNNFVISDEEFDKLEYELLLDLKSSGEYSDDEVDDIYNSLHMLSDSSSEWDEEQHNIEMLSLNKISKNSDMTIESYIGDINFEYILVQEKLDGISIDLEYVNGTLVKCITRGNGIKGFNLFRNLRHAKGIKLLIDDLFTGSIRGEVIITKDDFDEVQRLSGDRFENIRSAAGGISRTSKSTYARYLSCIVYDITSENLEFGTEAKKFDYLNKLGFDVVKTFAMYATKDNLTDIYNSYFEVCNGTTKRDQLPHLIDGLVFKVNDCSVSDSLGMKHGNRKGNVSIKFPSEGAETTLLDIEWNYGKSGILAPKGILEPVNILNSNIEKATLSNVNIIESLGISKGCTIRVVKSGDVIPYIESVTETTNDKFVIPTSCPICDHSLIKINSNLLCSNDVCKSKAIGDIITWFEKLEYKGLAGKTIDLLFESGYTTIESFYELKKEDLLNITGIQEKKAANIVKIINSKPEIEFYKILGSLNIVNCSHSRSKLITESLKIEDYTSFDTINDTHLSDIKGIKDSAPQIIDDIHSKLDFIEAMTKYIKYDYSIDVVNESGNLSGKSFCFTGKGTHSRKELEQIAIDNGGKKSAVNKSLDYLVVCDENQTSSSKYKKALTLNKEIINESTFLSFIE